MCGRLHVWPARLLETVWTRKPLRDPSSREHGSKIRLRFAFAVCTTVIPRDTDRRRPNMAGGLLVPVFFPELAGADGCVWPCGLYG